MDHLLKYCSGAIMAVMGMLAPVKGLIICAMIFVSIDFATGVWASYRKAARNGIVWGFESKKAWVTINKLAFIMGGIVLAWLIDSCILDFMNLRLAKIFTGFVCGIEFWSYLENAAAISGHPVFEKLKKLMKKQFETEMDINDRSK